MDVLSKKEELGRKVLVRTINEYLRRNLMSLEPEETPEIATRLEFEIDGIPAVAFAEGIANGEVTFSTALWPKRKGMDFIATAALNPSQRRAMGDFYVRGWLEREDGKWLQTSYGFKDLTYSSRRENDLRYIREEEGLGYSTTGRFIM